MPLARLYDFTPGTTIQSGQVDEEFNQLVNTLNGTKLDTVLFKSASAGDATVSVDNTGGGKVAEFRVGGVAKVRVNATGQVESTLATGTAPLSITSTTVNTNLNADMVDGKHASDLLLDVDPVIEESSSRSRLDFAQTTSLVRLNNDGTTFTVQNVTAGTTLLSINKSTGAASFIGQVKGITPVASEDLTRKDYVDGVGSTAQSNATTAAQVVSGQSGGTDGRVVRMTASANTWQDAVAGDTAAQLESLLFKSGGNYYKPGSLITGLSGLVAGANYWLNASTSPQLGTSALDPTASIRQVYIGKALSTTTLLFNPDRPIGG
jgi:hypothetical protein